jgi:hypothetical protein
MEVHSKIYLYDPQDREYKATVREVVSRAVGRGRVTTRVEAAIVSPKFKGDALVVIQDNVPQRTGWDWSASPLPPVRKGAVVQINHGDGLLLQCKVLGLAKGVGGWRGDDFVYEGIEAVANPNKSTGWRGHRFTAPASEVKNILKKGSGRRLLRGPYLTEREQQAFFAALYKAG